LARVAPEFAVQHFVQFLEAGVAGLATYLATGIVEAAGVAQRERLALDFLAKLKVPLAIIG